MASAARQPSVVPPLIPGIDDDNLLSTVADAIGKVALPDDPSRTIAWRYAKHVSDELARVALAAVREEIRAETICLGTVPAT